MNRNFRYFMFFLVFVGLLLTAHGCADGEDLPVEPVITEMWYDKSNEELKIRFTDGDGDFGLEPSDTIPPYQPLDMNGENNFFHFNLHVDVLYRENGLWLPVPLPDEEAIGYKFRVPDITPQGQNKQLRVLITWDFSGENDLIIQDFMDTVMYRARLIDRALNESVPGETEPVIFGD